MRGVREMVLQFARFGTVGVVNTLMTTVLILLLTWAGQRPYVANVVGYAAGTAFSFFANARWTFNAPLEGWRAVRFVVVIAVSYLVNLAVLAAALRMGLGELTSQVPAMVCFTVVNFIGQRHYTFRTEDPRP